MEAWLFKKWKRLFKKCCSNGEQELIPACKKRRGVGEGRGRKFASSSLNYKFGRGKKACKTTSAFVRRRRNEEEEEVEKQQKRHLCPHPLLPFPDK